jgi:glutaredoxin 2
LENNIQLINIPFVLNVLLYGDEGESYETNSLVFQQVQLFIKETGRFID